MKTQSIHHRYGTFTDYVIFGYAVRCSVESFPTFPANVIWPLKMS